MTTRPAGRVLLVDHTAVLGGAQLSLLDIATHLKSRAAVALFENGPFAAQLVSRGVAVLPIAIGDSLRSAKKDSAMPPFAAMAGGARAVWELASIARPFALLCANSPKSFLVSAMAGLIARRPVVWHLRDILDRAHFSAMNIELMVRTANIRAAKVIANSRATAAAFVSAGGRADLVVVVHNGIDPAPFDDLAIDTGAEMRRDLGIDARSYVIGSFSRLHPWKGQQVVLDALERIPDAHALIVGGAVFSGEDAFERQLIARSLQPSLAGRVHMLGARYDVPRLMAVCDVVVHASVAPEPFGRVLVEALLAERPLIASDSGGVREVVQDGVTGLLVPPGDARALALAVEVLRNDPARAASLASAGAADVRQRFSRDAMLAGVTRVLDGVIAGLSR